MITYLYFYHTGGNNVDVLRLYYITHTSAFGVGVEREACTAIGQTAEANCPLTPITEHDQITLIPHFSKTCLDRLLVQHIRRYVPNLHHSGRS